MGSFLATTQTNGLCIEVSLILGFRSGVLYIQNDNGMDY